MDQVGTLPAVRYWSEVLCCTTVNYLSDLEVKVMDFDIIWREAISRSIDLSICFQYSVNHLT